MGKIRKALLAGLTTAVGALVAAVTSQGTLAVGWPQVVGALVLGIGAGYAVYKVPNKTA